MELDGGLAQQRRQIYHRRAAEAAKAQADIDKKFPRVSTAYALDRPPLTSRSSTSAHDAQKESDALNDFELELHTGIGPDRTLFPAPAQPPAFSSDPVPPQRVPIRNHKNQRMMRACAGPDRQAGALRRRLQRPVHHPHLRRPRRAEAARQRCGPRPARNTTPPDARTASHPRCTEPPGGRASRGILLQRQITPCRGRVDRAGRDGPGRGDGPSRAADVKGDGDGGRQGN